MSTTIEQSVVEMRFDNSHFEKNVQTTLSTIDKLKQKLNLTGASKGLENINAASKNNNIGELGRAAETVGLKFSAMQVAGVTAITRLTNSAINMGEKMVKALTIDPIKTGLQEYETQMNAVQTILANTQSKGSTIKDVNAALAELNTYADKTIYNFTEMTRNIGTFTAAGVDLDTSVSAIQGIANLAAVSGSTSQQASTAMYQLSQALAAGTVKLQDWNSVVNAGMGGEVFQNALKRTATTMGINVDAMIEKYGSFRESLSRGEWLTTEVLTKTLEQFTMSAKEGSKEWDKFKESLMMEGYTEKQAVEILKMANTATDAATKVKTFTQLWDVLKESAQSGWAQTWQLIIGDFEQAKSLLSPLADFLTGIINGMSEARNALLKSALGKSFVDLKEKISMVAKPMTTAVDGVKTAVSALKDTAEGVEKVMSGVFGDGPERWKKLTEAGYDWADVQNKVNEKLGSSVRHTSEYTKKQKESVETQKEVTESQAKQIEELAKLSDKQLKSKGYTEEQIKAFRELADVANKLGLPISELIEHIDEIDGRWLIWNSLKNVGMSIYKIFKAIGDAWSDAFSMDGNQLFNIIAGLHKFTTYLVISDETAEKLTRTLKGVFAIFDIIASIAGGAFRIGVQIFQELLRALGYGADDILTLTANVGDAIVAFRDWFEEHNAITKAIKVIVPFLVKMGKAAVDLAEHLYEMSGIDGIINDISKSFSGFGDTIIDIVKTLGKLDKITFDDIKTAILTVAESIQAALENISFITDSVGLDFVAGFANGIISGVSQAVQAVLDFGKTMLDKLRESIDSHSPSKATHEIGIDFVMGFWNGIKEFVGNVFTDILGFGEKCVTTLSNIINAIPWSNLFAAGASGAMVYTLKKLLDVVSAVVSPLEGLGDVFGGVGKVLEKSAKPIAKVIKSTATVVKNFGKILGGISMNIKAKALKEVAVAIAILVGSIVLLTYVNQDNLWSALGVMMVLSGVLVGIGFALDKMSAAAVTINKNGIKFGGLKTTLLMIAASVLLLGLAAKMVGGMDGKQYLKGIGGVILLIAAMGGLMAAYATLVKGKAAKNVGKFGGTLVKLSIAMLLLAGVAKIISGMTWGDMGKAGAGIAAFTIFVGALVGITRFAGKNVDKVGSMILKLSIALGVLALVVRLIGGLDNNAMIKGGIFIGAFTVFVWALVNIVKDMGKDIPKLSGLLLSISAAMLILTGIAKVIAGMTWNEMKKAGVGIAGLTGVIYILIEMVKKVEKDAPKIAGTLLAISLAMGILVGVAKLIATMEWGDMGKAAVGFGGLLIIMNLLINMVKKVGNQAPKIAGTLLAMSVAMGILAGVAIILSLISLEGLAKGVIAISTLGYIMSLMIKATQGANEVKGTIIALSIAIGVMAASIAVLSLIDFSKLAGATVALGTLMGMFAIIVKSSRNITTSIGPLIVMTVAVGLLAVILGSLSKLPVDSTIGTAAALSILLLSFSACMKTMSAMNAVSPQALLAMGALTLVVGALAVILGILGKMNIQNSLEIAASLSLLLISMSASCVILAGVGIFAPQAIMGALALDGVILAIGAFVTSIGWLVTKFPMLEDFLNKGIPIIEKIGYAIGSFFGNIIGGFMGGATSALPQIAEDLTNFMNGITTFVEGAKGVNEEALAGVRNLVEMMVLITGANFLEKIATFGSNTSSMEEFAIHLGTFADAIVNFSNKIKGNIDEEAILAAANAGKMLAEMQSMISSTGGVFQLFTGEKDLSAFSTQIMAFADAIVQFSQKVKGNIDEEAVLAAANAGKLLAELQGATASSGGVVQFFTGEKDLALFGQQIVAYGEAIAAFSNALVQNGGIDEAAISAAANAGHIMTELQKAIEPTGGVMQLFTGERDLATFGAQLKAYGEAVTGFSKAVSGEGAINEEAITAAANAGHIMTKLQSAIEPTGGVLQWFSGTTGLDTFGAQLKAYGSAISEFSKSISGENAIDDEAITAAANAGKIMAEVQKGIPEDKWLDGKMSLDDFGGKIKKFGESMKEYSDEVTDIDIDAIHSSTTAAKNLVVIARSASKIDADNVGKFGKVKTIGEALKTYSDKIAKVETSKINSSITAINRLATVISNLAGMDTSGASSFKKAISTMADADLNGLTEGLSKSLPKLTRMGTDIIDALVKGIKSKRGTIVTQVLEMGDEMAKAFRAKQNLFIKVGSDYMGNLAKGIRNHRSAVLNAIKDVSGYGAKHSREYYQSYYNAGSYLVTGFANGISANAYKAKAKARAMAKAAKQAAEEALGIHSPSKVFFTIGSYVVEGFANALSKGAKTTYSVTSELANTATDSFSNAISKINDYLNGNMESRPTIRPVLDLSEIQSGASTIGSIFGNPTVGVMSNLGAISRTMNSRTKNATNDDVVSAIDKLHKELGNVGGGNTYTIGGITYDSDSSIGNAIEQLVRAITIEGRV